MENPYCSCKLTPCLTAAVPVENPYCSCKLTRPRAHPLQILWETFGELPFLKDLPYPLLQVSHGLQLQQSLWRTPAAAVSQQL